MFNKPLNGLTLAGRDADAVFGKIYGDKFGNRRDESFVATLRALLPNRMPNNDDHVAFICRSIGLSEGSIQSHSADYLFQRGYLPQHNEIALLCVDCEGAGNEKLFEKFDSEAGQRMIESNFGFRELKDLKQFLSRYMVARCFINERNRATVIIVSRPDYRNFHFIQSLIPRYLPWYFCDKPIDDVEKDLLRSLTQRYATDYERIIEEYAQKIDFREYKIKTMLGNFEKNARQKQLEGVVTEIRMVNQSIERNVMEYADLIKRLDDRRIYESGLKSMIASGSDGSELVEYFMCNRNVSPVATAGSSIAIIIKCFIDNFDPEVYARTANNPNSDIYRLTSQEVFKNPDDLKMFFDDVMSDDPNLKIKVCGYYVLDTRGSASSESGYRYPRDCADRVPNPHLQHYACLGNNRRYIESALREGDTIRAIEQCFGSAKCLNLTETHTFVHFINDISACNAPVVQLRDGTSLTPADALEWLKKKKAEEANKEEGQNV